MAYVTPKDFVDAFLTALRADTGTMLSTAIFRKGPQRALRLAGTETAIVFVAVSGMEGGEQSAGSGNNWWHEWRLECTLMVPDDEADPEGAEDARLDLLDEFGEFLHANRTIGGAKVGHMSSAELQFGTLFENTTQVFRAARVVVTYRTLRS